MKNFTHTEDFFYDFEGNQKDLLLHLHHLLATELELTSKIRYKIPFYYRKSWICYLNPDKIGGVELVFLRGNELSNANGLLDFKGRKQVAGIYFSSIADILHDKLLETIHEAIILDNTIKYKSKRKP